MTMLPCICRSTVSATMWTAARGPVLSIVPFVLGGINMELTLYKLASFPVAASGPVLVIVCMVLGGICMELFLYILTSLPFGRSR